jgi:hypothetical protein
MRSTGCLLVIVVLFMALVGCSTSTSWYQSADGPSPTGGLGVQMELRNTETNQFARFRVEPDGAFTYWGGKDVLFDSITWEGVIDGDQGRGLSQLVRKEGLMQPPAGGADGAEPIWELQLVDGTATRSYTVYGENASLQSLYGFLQDIASARFTSILDALPQPSVEVLVAPATGPDDTEEQP